MKTCKTQNIQNDETISNIENNNWTIKIKLKQLKTLKA